MPSYRIILCLLTVLIAACGARPEGQKPKASQTSAKPLLITREDLVSVENTELASGPVITGSIQPERKADLRSEIAATILQVLKENGEVVKKSELLVRLDDTAIRDSLQSAEEAARASAQTLDQAERQFQRLKTLRASGMTSMQQLEDAEVRRNNAQSDLVAAKARAVSARQQLQRTEVRAPFDGIVSERKVSPGDTALVGKELLKVIDPNSMRFEGLVVADKATDIKVGQSVSFRVNGYAGQVFSGKVKRVDVAANATTRQVEVLVALDQAQQPKMAGLYAEGRIEVATSTTLMLANTAILKEGDNNFVWRYKDGVVNKIAVKLGERDPRRGDFVVLGGLANGDKLIRNPMSTLKDGQTAQMVASAGSTAAASSAASTNQLNAPATGKAQPGKP